MEQHPRHGDEHIAAEAADWLLRFKESAAGRPLDHAEFAEWLTRSPQHVREFLEATTLWATIGTVSADNYDVEQLIAAARAEQAQGRVVQLTARRDAIVSTHLPRGRVRRACVGLAASLLVGFAMWGGWILSQRGAEFSTAIGEQRNVTLPDGSVLFLNTNSEVRIRYGQRSRDIDLIRGEARFQVAKLAQRPFVVATTDATIRALGTVFNVVMGKEGTQVTVIEGRVELRERGTSGASSPPGAPGSGNVSGTAKTQRHDRVELATGQRAAVTSKGIVPDVGPSIESANAWTQHRLVYRDRTLAEVVGEFNRFRVQQLVIDDPELAGLRISGSFDPSDPDSLVAYLGAVEAVRVSTPADGNVHLAREHH